MTGFTPPRLGRRHLIFGAVLTLIGLTLFFDSFSPEQAVYIGGLLTWQRNSWFFPTINHESEADLGAIAVAIAVVWVGGTVGWWIVRTILQVWFHKLWREETRRP